MGTHTLNGQNFSNLAPYQKRMFVPDEANLGNVDEVVSLYQRLCDRNINSAGVLETFLMNRSELDAAVKQQEEILLIRMTCQTDDPQRATAYKKFIETIPPAVKPLTDKLDRKYLAAWRKFPLDKKRYEVYNRAIRTDVELFREKNVELQKQEDLLVQEYQTLCGTLTVNFQGSEKTMPEMGKFLYEPDMALRKSAWLAAAERRLQEKDRFDELFDKMLTLRVQIAKNADLDNYCDYKFRQYHRFDYTVEDCKNFHNAVENLVVPFLKKVYQRRAEEMGIEQLRPWDLYSDSKGRDALKPFETVDEYISGVKTIFSRVDTELGRQFDELPRLGLLDLASRKGKAPGGYQENLSEARKPFIFANAVGTNDDVHTLLHEGGHAFHALACSREPLLAYRHPPIEFCEVASMSMELLGGPHLSVFYNDECLRRCWREHLEGIVFLLVWVAAIDAFQHWLYENPSHNRDDRTKTWLGIHGRFGGELVDWSDLQEQHAYRWHRQLHIFQVPFYYIEYAIAQLGALQLWLAARKDTPSVIANYRKALALGGSRPLPELFAAAGLEFDFSEKTIGLLIKAVARELEIA